MLYCTTNRTKHRGIALVIVLMFVTIFAGLSVSMFSMTSSNLQAVRNVHQSSTARVSAESGLELIRYYTNRITLPGTTDQAQRFADFAAAMESAMGAVCTVTYDADLELLTLGTAETPVRLQTADGQGFYARITPDGTDGVDLRITGSVDAFERTIRTGFSYRQKRAGVFDYGVATRGTLKLGNLSLSGAHTDGEANLYIESLDTTDSLTIQNSQIAGDVHIANPDATVSISGGQSSIGGESGQAAVDQHVTTGVDAIEFPVPDPAYFEQYVDGITIDAWTDESLYQGGTLENVRIAADTNPTFNAGTQITGILYIEQPNEVQFSGHCSITGIIVADGDVTDNSGDNTLVFRGTVSTQGVDALPDEPRYDGLRDNPGIFIMAPGFAVSMGGNFDTLNGCIIANGVTFFGHAGGEIGGTILNYADGTMELSGDDLVFNRPAGTEMPAGFFPEIEIRYNPATYQEIS